MQKNQLITFILILSLILILFFLFVLSFQLTPKQKKSLQPKASQKPFFGFNIHSLPLLDPSSINQTLTMISQCNNSTVVRFFGFSGHGETYEKRRLNAIDNIDAVLKNSPSHMRFIIALSNYYKSGVFQPWPAAEENPTRWFSSDWKTNGFKDFVNAVTQRYRANEKILIWEIMNEPNCTGDNQCIQAQHQFLKEVSGLIAQNDPGKLISAGNQAQNTYGENFDNGDFEKIVQMPHLSAVSCHLYLNEPYSKANCLRAFQITKKYNKFFYLGELGQKTDCTSKGCTNICPLEKLIERKQTLLQIKDEFDALGSQGVLIWQYSLERNPLLTCDDYSIFPNDPLCNPHLSLNQDASPTSSTSLPTPTPSLPLGTIKLNLKLRFQGILKKPLDNHLSVKISLKKLTDEKLNSTLGNFSADDKGVFSGSVSFGRLTPGRYQIFIKGPKHLQRKICHPQPKEEKPYQYRCDKDHAIDLKLGENSFDFSHIILLAGDLPTQDGLTDARDISFIRNNLNKTDRVALKFNDINLDKIVDTQDYSLSISSLTIRYDDEK